MRALSDSSFAVILVIAKWKRAIINLCTQEFSLEMKLKAPSTTKPLYLVLYTLTLCALSVLQLVYKVIPLSTADEKLFDVLSPMWFLSLKAKYVGITGRQLGKLAITITIGTEKLLWKDDKMESSNFKTVC